MQDNGSLHVNVDEIKPPEATAAEPAPSASVPDVSSDGVPTDHPLESGEHSLLRARVADLEAQLAARDEAFQEMKLHATRLAADFENSRQRWTRERSELVKSAGERVLEQFLEVLDNFERAIQVGERATEPQQVLTGVHMIYKQVLDFLSKEGVSPMNAAGRPFDPNQHEAVVQEESEEHPDQTVLDEFRRGYMLNGRVLRHALVKIASNPAMPHTPAAPAEEPIPTPSEPASPDSAI
jgi:molecular chaperone GrpE